MLQEIYYDEFWEQLQEWSKRLSPCTILEIGGGTGDGSTTAFFDAVELGSTVFSIEGRKERYEELRKKPVKAIYGCSVEPPDYMTKQEVKDFYNHCPTNLNANSLRTVLKWRSEELRTLKHIPTNVIKGIQAELVFIDGSPFTGEKEFLYSVEQNPAVRVVALDDVNDIKNFRNYWKLLTSTDWEKAWENISLRNGAAIFVKKK